jgi:hypothetical protein
MKKRAERKISFLVAFFLVAGGINSYGQEGGLPLKTPVYAHPVTLAKPAPAPRAAQRTLTGSGLPYLLLSPSGSSFSGLSLSGGQPMIPSNLYYIQSGFFCKREWELERATHVPLRFRLGSLDYCNGLEGKH